MNASPESRMPLPSRFLRASLLLLGALSPAVAQTARKLTLTEAISIALERGADARVAAANLESVRSSNRLVSTQTRPRVELSTTLARFDHSINQIALPDGSVQYVGQSNNRSSVGVGVSQAISATGATVTLGTDLSRADQFGSLSSRQWASTPVLLGFNQPLFQVNRFEWDRRVSDASLELNERLYADTRADVARRVANQYMELHRAEVSLRNARVNAGVSDTILSFNEARYGTGNVTALELSRSEGESLNSRMTVEQAQLDRDLAAARLALLIGLPEAEAIVTEEPVLPDTSTVVTEAVLEAVGRTSVAAARFRNDSLVSARQLAIARATSRASATLNGSVGFNQTGTTLPLAYDSPLGKQTANLFLTLPILEWGASRARVDQERYAFDARIAASRRDVEQAKQDARFAARALRVSKENLRLATIADSLASTRFRIARLQYSNGAIDYTNFLIYQRDKDNAVMNRVQAVSRFWDQYYNLKRLIGTQ